MNEQELLKKIAYLEFVNDQLNAELHELDGLMRKVGFQNGLETVKATAIELYEYGIDDDIEDAI